MSVSPTVELVHNAMTSAFDGMTLKDGDVLTCSNRRVSIDTVPDSQIPYLLLKTGRWSSSEYQPFQYYIEWDISAELKVKGKEPHDIENIARQVMDDLITQTAKMRALLVDDQLQVYTYSQKSIDLYSAGKLTALADRGGPIFKSMAMRPVAGESPYGIADLIWHVEFLAERDPAVYGKLGSVSVGITPAAPGLPYPLGDIEQPYRYQFPLPAQVGDIRAQGRFAGPDSTLTPGYTRSSPPFPPGSTPGNTNIPSVSGQDYRKLIKELNVNPSTATFPHTSTFQLTGIAIRIDGSSFVIGSGNATWTSSAPSVATVNNSGLVTGVSAGSAVITCTFSGVSNTSSLTLT